MDSLRQFVLRAEKDLELQARIQQASCADKLVDLAESVGCELTSSQIRSRSRDLSAAYWPWAGKTNEWRRNWFGES